MKYCDTFEEFILKLKELFDGEEEFATYTWDEDIKENIVDYNDTANHLSAECNAWLISGGSPNFDRISELKRNGFNVHAGERDSFGWLSGVVERNGRELIFG